ncbi:MAG: hypothetical protein WBQ25_09700 [Nitrososphaeraceae archaeon]
MSRETIDNDDNDNDPESNKEEEKVSLLVENKQSEEQLPIGQDFETEVLNEKDDKQTSTIPTRQKEGGTMSRAKVKKKEKRKKLIKPVARLAETRRLTDLKGQLAKQTDNIDQIIKILKPLQKYITTTERQFKSIKQIEGQIKQLQKQTLDLLKIVRKVK